MAPERAMSAGRAQRRRLQRNAGRVPAAEAVAMVMAESPSLGCTCGGTFKRLLHDGPTTIVVVGHDLGCPLPRGWRDPYPPGWRRRG